MILEIVLYFFTVFGMMQFVLFLWEIYTHKIVKNSSFIVVREVEDRTKLSEILYILRKYPLSIYAVSDKNGNFDDLSEIYENVYPVTKSQLTDIINGD